MSREAPEGNPHISRRRLLTKTGRLIGSPIVVGLLQSLEQVSSVKASETPQRGDLNGDGKLNNKDVKMLKRLVRARESYESRSQGSDADPRHYWETADVNVDGKINWLDVRVLEAVIKRKR